MSVNTVVFGRGERYNRAKCGANPATIPDLRKSNCQQFSALINSPAVAAFYRFDIYRHLSWERTPAIAASHRNVRGREVQSGPFFATFRGKDAIRTSEAKIRSALIRLWPDKCDYTRPNPLWFTIACKSSWDG